MKTVKIEISDDNILNGFKSFVKNRETYLNREVSSEAVEKVNELYLKPMTKKCTSFRTKMTLTQLEEHAGNIFTLSMYGKKHPVSNWSSPSIDNKTPDFSINDGSETIEIYSPILKEIIPNLKSLTCNVQNKTEKYKSISNLKIIVQIISEQFIRDVINALKKVTLINRNHSLFLYHGEIEIPISDIASP